MNDNLRSGIAGGKFYFILLAAITLLLGYLSYHILLPFFTPIAWAMVFAILFYPLYALILRHLRWKSVASALVVILVLLIVIGPVSYLSFLLVNELSSFANGLDRGGVGSIMNVLEHSWVRMAVDRLATLADMSPGEWNKMVTSQVTQLGRQLAMGITSGMGSVLAMAINFIIMSLTLFFFLRDGRILMEKILEFMPFSDEQKGKMIQQIRDIIISTMYGGVVVSLVQGAMGGLAFSILGLSAPVVWGMAMALAAFLPVFGPFVIWGPAAVILIVQGEIWRGVALVVIGTLGIGLIDNFLRPILVGQRTKISFLVLFFSVIGGIKFFGMIGFVMGPLVLALFVSVLKVCRSLEGHDQSPSPST